VCAPRFAGCASVTVVSCASSSLATAATGAPSRRTSRNFSLRELKMMVRVAVRTCSVTDSLPAIVIASMSGTTATR